MEFVEGLAFFAAGGLFPAIVFAVLALAVAVAVSKIAEAIIGYFVEEALALLSRSLRSIASSRKPDRTNALGWRHPAGLQSGLALT